MRLVKVRYLDNLDDNRDNLAILIATGINIPNEIRVDILYFAPNIYLLRSEIDLDK